MDVVDGERREEGKPSKGSPYRLVGSATHGACNREVSFELRFAATSARDNRNSGRTYGVGRCVEARDGDLEYLFTVEPCRARAYLAVNRVHQPSYSRPKHVD